MRQNERIHSIKWRGISQDEKGLIEAADRALYESKDKGKKRVTLKI